MKFIEKISALFFSLAILGGCIYALYDIIIKIIKLLEEDNKKKIGNIVGLFIALIIVFILVIIDIMIFYNILLKNKYNIVR